MTDERRPDAIVVIDPDDREYALKVAQAEGVEVKEMEVVGIEPVLTITLAIFGTAAAVGAVAHLIEVHKGGQIIDLRPGAPKVAYRDKGVVYGTVIILATDGKVTVEVHEPKGLFGQVMDALTKVTVDVATAGIDAIGDAAKNAVGDKADVKVEHA